MAKSSKRDLIIIILLLTLSLVSYFVYQAVINNRNVSKANVFYHSDIVVVIDFELGKIEKISEQLNASDYPIIDLEARTITLLGDHTINNVRQEVVIEYNFIRKSVQIIKEESPNNICSKLGESTGSPLICAPNGIRVRFDFGEDLDHEI